MGVEVLTKSEVFEQYGVELTRFATSLVGPTDAQDIVVDALVGCMWSDKWDDVKNQRAYLYPWTSSAPKSWRLWLSVRAGLSCPYGVRCRPSR